MTNPHRISEAPATDLSRRSARMGLAFLLLTRLLLGLVYAAINPLGEAPDEADHYAYAAYIARTGELPAGPDEDPRKGEMTQSKHPPLYYLFAAGLARAAGVEPDFSFLRANPDVGVALDAQAPNFFIHTRLEAWPWRDGPLAMHLGRMVSVLAGVLLTAATYGLGRAVWPGWYAGPLAAAAFVAFLPEALFVGAAMSNDMLAAMWITLALWLGLRAGWWAVVGAGLCMGLAMLTKASTAALWPVVCLAMWVQGSGGAEERRSRGAEEQESPFGRAEEQGGERARRWVRGLARPVAAGVVALGVAAPWLLRNWQLYGDALGWPLVLATIDQRQGPLTLSDIGRLARGWFIGFYGKFGGAGHIPLPAPFYWAWTALLFAVAAGWAAVMLRKRTAPASRIAPEGWIVMLGAPLMAVLAILSYSRTALGTDQGRLLFPALAVAGLWAAGGLSAWLPTQRLPSMPLWLGGAMAALAVLALVLGIARPFAAPPAPDAATVAVATPVEKHFGDDLELLGFRWSDGEPRALTLYWQAQRAPTTDLRTDVRLFDGSGNLLWEWKRSPGAGRYATDRWPAGRVVEDGYRIPPDAADAQRVEVGVRPFPEGPWLSVNGQDVLLLSQPSH